MSNTIFRIERTLDGGQFLYASVGQFDPTPLEIEVPHELCDSLGELQDLGQDNETVILGTTYRVNGSVSMDNEVQFWTIANSILEIGKDVFNG